MTDFLYKFNMALNLINSLNTINSLRPQIVNFHRKTKISINSRTKIIKKNYVNDFKKLVSLKYINLKKKIKKKKNLKNLFNILKYNKLFKFKIFMNLRLYFKMFTTLFYIKKKHKFFNNFFKLKKKSKLNKIKMFVQSYFTVLTLVNKINVGVVLFLNIALDYFLMNYNKKNKKLIKIKTNSGHTKNLFITYYSKRYANIDSLLGLQGVFSSSIDENFYFLKEFNLTKQFLYYFEIYLPKMSKILIKKKLKKTTEEKFYLTHVPFRFFEHLPVVIGNKKNRFFKTYFKSTSLKNALKGTLPILNLININYNFIKGLFLFKKRINFLNFNNNLKLNTFYFNLYPINFIKLKNAYDYDQFNYSSILTYFKVFFKKKKILKIFNFKSKRILKLNILNKKKLIIFKKIEQYRIRKSIKKSIKKKFKFMKKFKHKLNKKIIKKCIKKIIFKRFLSLKKLIFKSNRKLNSSLFFLKNKQKINLLKKFFKINSNLIKFNKYNKVDLKYNLNLRTKINKLFFKLFNNLKLKQQKKLKIKKFNKTLKKNLFFIFNKFNNFLKFNRTLNSSSSLYSSKFKIRFLTGYYLKFIQFKTFMKKFKMYNKFLNYLVFLILIF